MNKNQYHTYNAIKNGHNKNNFTALRIKKQLWMYEHLKKYESIIDYGSSNGWLKEYYEPMNFKIQEVDEIENKNSLIKCDQADIIVSVTVLEHMTPKEIKKFLEDSKKVSKRLFLVTNNPECEFSHRVLWDDITHTRMYTRDSIEGLLLLKGARIINKGFADPVIFRWNKTLLDLWFWHVKKNPFNITKGLYNRNPYNYWFIEAEWN